MNHLAIDEIISTLKENLIAYKDIEFFSKKPGIYAIGFNGVRFPLASAEVNIKNGVIIYVGKTESSQIERDEKTHFQTGGTKNSTVRRSIGAIIREKLHLNPMPRSFTEITEKRFTNYCFDKIGEKSLTKWMEDNLSLSFWEYFGLVSELKGIEICFIHQLKPILNLNNNPKNPWKNEIKALRKVCSEMAKQYIKNDLQC